MLRYSVLAAISYQIIKFLSIPYQILLNITFLL